MPAKARAAKSNAAIAVIGIDIGKNVFHLIGIDQRGAIVFGPPPAPASRPVSPDSRTAAAWPGLPLCPLGSTPTPAFPLDRRPVFCAVPN
jgi:hypothetical protein